MGRLASRVPSYPWWSAAWTCRGIFFADLLSASVSCCTKLVTDFARRRFYFSASAACGISRGCHVCFVGYACTDTLGLRRQPLCCVGVNKSFVPSIVLIFWLFREPRQFRIRGRPGEMGNVSNHFPKSKVRLRFVSAIQTIPKI
jgi:hypothetical protein